MFPVTLLWYEYESRGSNPGGFPLNKMAHTYFIIPTLTYLLKHTYFIIPTLSRRKVLSRVAIIDRIAHAGESVRY